MDTGLPGVGASVEAVYFIMAIFFYVTEKPHSDSQTLSTRQVRKDRLKLGLRELLKINKCGFIKFNMQ
jgi:hypothetical protein